MNDHCCPVCESNNIVMTDDFVRDLTILKCKSCGEMFAVSNTDVCTHNEGWAFNEWANSIMAQKRLSGLSSNHF